MTAPGFDGVQTRVSVSDAPHALCSHCDGSGREPAPGRVLLSVTLEMQTVSEANSRDRFTQRKRKAAQRLAVRAWLDGRHHHHEHSLRPVSAPLDVVLTRITPRAAGLDDDNLGSSFKAIRDEVAAWLGIDDRDPRVSWRCAQEKGAPKQWAVRIEIRERRKP